MIMKSLHVRIIICLTAFMFFSSVGSALCAEMFMGKELPLGASDDRVIKGNVALFQELAIKEKELDDIFEKYKASLTPDLRVLFDESQLDWEDCMRDEKRSFQPADRWTRANPKSEYENLYRKNLISAVNFRKSQIERFRSKSVTATDDISKLEAEKKYIKTELDELNYRVTIWTPELLRYRVYRSMRTWNRYYDNSMTFFRVFCSYAPEKIISLEMELLRYRHEYMKVQREALYRLKFEAEEL